MPIFVILDAEQRSLEAAADALLRTVPPDCERPFYTERRLAQKELRMVHIAQVDGLADMERAPSQSFREEVRFLAAVSRLDDALRICLLLWVDGWRQQDIATALRISQQGVSRRLQAALRICYSALPLSFRHFSHRSLYRTPAHARQVGWTGSCAHCGEPFMSRGREARFCSSACRSDSKKARLVPKKIEKKLDSGIKKG